MKPSQCYFLLSASPALPVLYYVERLREGKSYATRFVRAVQNGKIVFIMMCSFHRPEPQHPMVRLAAILTRPAVLSSSFVSAFLQKHQWSMPKGVPPPEQIESDIEYYSRLAHGEGISAKAKVILQEMIAVSDSSSFPVGIHLDGRNASGTLKKSFSN